MNRGLLGMWRGMGAGVLLLLVCGAPVVASPINLLSGGASRISVPGSGGGSLLSQPWQQNQDIWSISSGTLITGETPMRGGILVISAVSSIEFYGTLALPDLVWDHTSDFDPTHVIVGGYTTTSTTSRLGSGYSGSSVLDCTVYRYSGYSWYDCDFVLGYVGSVPEPASLGLLAVGGLVMLRRRRA